ncbi:hypothetical protein TNCV_2016871 [Trichonephila clavipes]|nr:hypothetical protein TNCV_2016871 [Trichonephila clavipes]
MTPRFEGGEQSPLKPNLWGPTGTSNDDLGVGCGRTSYILSINLGCSMAFGDGLRNFEPWSSDVDDTSPNYHTNGRAFQLSTDLTSIAALHGGS